MTRIAVLVSGGGTNLQALIDAQRAGHIKSGRIELVVSSRKDAYALTRAEDAHIDAVALSRKELGAEGFEEALSNLLAMHRIDLIVLAGFLTILSGPFVEKWPQRIINVHPSLIPAFSGEGYYGLKVHEAALKRGVKVTGATVHYVNAIPDGGEIILQKPVRVHKNDTPETLQLRVMQTAEWRILPEAVERVSRMIDKKKGK